MGASHSQWDPAGRAASDPCDPAMLGHDRVRKYTPQQEAIFETVREGQHHLIVEALAGTGKTTTAVGFLAGQGLGGKVGFVAFNAHIAGELRSRLPASVTACTLHSLGFAAVRRAFPGIQVDDAKLVKLVRQLAPEWYPSTRQAAERLARLCKYTLTDPVRPDLASLVDHYNVDLDQRDEDKVYRLVGDLLDQSAEMTTIIDYDDMVWFPHRHQLRPDQFDLLVVDESQDLNRAQQALALSATASGRLCPIGDRHQAIYGFAGADCDALPRLGAHLGQESRGARTLPLTVTWRCPASHVVLAQRIVPTLEAAPGAGDGEIETMPLRAIGRAVEAGDLVICRKNAPVVALTYKLVLAGVPAIMRGRDIGRGLTSLIRRLKPTSCSDLVDRIEDFRDKETRRLERKSAGAGQFDSLNDKCDCLQQLASQAETLDDLERFIEQRFSDVEKPGAAVVLSSVHRAKGLEADRVFVLDTENLFLTGRKTQPWEVQQARNLVYIALTRSKRCLIFENCMPSL